MGRKSYRSRRGGDASQVMVLENKVNTLQEDLNKIKKELSSVKTSETRDESKMVSMIPGSVSKSNTVVEKVLPINDQKISVKGFTGKVGDLKSKIKGKISQLTRPNNKGRYQDKADKMKGLLEKINNLSSVREIESLVNNNATIMFKNNNLMGGKRTMKKKSRNNKKRKSKRKSKRH